MSPSIPNPSGAENAVLEKALEVFKSLALASVDHKAELTKARLEFFGPAGNRVSSIDAERRLFEWFLFERPYAEFGGVGARALAEDWLAQVGEELAPLLPGLIDSRVGVYEVTSIEPGSGVWVRDLSGVGEYPLVEPEAATEFQVGDLLVGRLYPVSDGVFVSSAAAACVRNKDLADALRRDLSQARNERRGVPRLSQQTIEALFFQSAMITASSAPTSAATPAPEPPSIEQVLAECREWLVTQGLTTGDVEEIFDALAEEPSDPADLAPGGSDILGGILAELAFQSDVDLGEARARLLAAWTMLSAPNLPEGAVSRARTEVEPELQHSENAAQRALLAFDATRVSGGRIEDAFEQLEQDLGLEPGSSEDPDDTVPDFPGVVGAMVEEFLWERAAKHKPELNSKALHQFAAFAAHIGAFEDVTHGDLLLFSGCFLIERGKLTSAEDARQALEALDQFCRWAEQEHSVELWTLFSDSFAELSESLPRLVAARRLLEEHAASSRVLLYQIETNLRAKRVEHADKSFDVDEQLREHLRPGDLVRALRNGDALTVVGCYPALVRDILQPKA